MQYKSQRPPSLDRGRYYIEPSTSISPTTYSSPSMHPARVASTTEGRAPSRASRVEKANASAQKAEIYGDKSAAATSTAASNVMSKTINDDEKNRKISVDTYALIISVGILFLVIWFTSDLKTAFNGTLFLICSLIFILNMINTYQLLMESKFKFRENYRWWIYFVISTILAVIFAIALLPIFFLIISSTISFCVLVGLLLYDLIKRFFKG